MPHLYIEGTNGQIEADEEWLRIHRKGLMARGTPSLGRTIKMRLTDIIDIAISFPRIVDGDTRLPFRQEGSAESPDLFVRIDARRETVSALERANSL